MTDASVLLDSLCSEFVTEKNEERYVREAFSVVLGRIVWES